MKTLYERNDFEQKRLMLAYFNRASKVLDEKERLARRRPIPESIDVVINCNDGFTEIYVPVKDDQKGPLTTLLKSYCKQTIEDEGGKVTEGEYKRFAVYKVEKTIEGKKLGEILLFNTPGRFANYHLCLAPAFNFSFDSETVYPGAKTAQAVSVAVKHTSDVPKNDIVQIKNYMKQGLSIQEISKKTGKYDTGQIRSITNHIKMGTYDRPMQEISSDLDEKLFKEFKGGMSNEDVADRYKLNKFQVIARRAKYTRLKNLGRVK